jgi:hypothetical protein
VVLAVGTRFVFDKDLKTYRGHAGLSHDGGLRPIQKLGRL